MVEKSRIPGFHKKTVKERQALLRESVPLDETDLRNLESGGLDLSIAERMIENAVGVYSLPLGIATNFRINQRDVLVPMVIEEPSVVAGASYAARLAREGGGFTAETDPPEMIGQIQLMDVPDLDAGERALLEHRAEILTEAGRADPALAKAGGGPREISVRRIASSPAGSFLVVHLIIDARDAMGANAVNTACERIAPLIEKLSGGRAALRILSNLADRRLARARCAIPVESLAFDAWNGDRVRDGILEAYAFAAADPYRAATHNKGIMNGVDAVAIATGNDWRAGEAGAHAYAARGGSYTSLSRWERDAAGNLAGYLEMPMAAGIIGGTTRVHPLAQTALKILGVHSARELAEVIVSVGLAQNLAALRALATEGIQRGHMRLHARQVAIAAGAKGDAVEKVADRLIQENAIQIDRAQALVRELQ
jgi:hydroxymethylglutaryl-CoA reductase